MKRKDSPRKESCSPAHVEIVGYLNQQQQQQQQQHTTTKKKKEEEAGWCAVFPRSATQFRQTSKELGDFPLREASKYVCPEKRQKKKVIVRKKKK